MSLVVAKFGGTSVASPERIQTVAKRLIQKKEEGNQVVAVVSAMGKTTDELLDLANAVNVRWTCCSQRVSRSAWRYWRWLSRRSAMKL